MTVMVKKNKKKDNLLKNFSLLTYALINTFFGLSSIKTLKEVILAMKRETPLFLTLYKEGPFEKIKEIVRFVSTNHKLDMLSMIGASYDIVNRMISTYLVLKNRKKLTTKEIKLLNADNIITTTINKIASNIIVKNI